MSLTENTTGPPRSNFGITFPEAGCHLLPALSQIQRAVLFDFSFFQVKY
jgi:hypothetical protein